MLWLDLPKERKDTYKRRLQLVGALSRLFSDSDVPYLYYRSAERIFCSSLNAEDRSRSDVSVDATIDINGQRLGIGLKTFLGDSLNSSQKIAEFNKLRPQYESLTGKSLVEFIAEARNRRLLTTQTQYNSSQLEYHLVVRSKGIFRLFEYPMDLVKLDTITNISSSPSSISFDDQHHHYSFNKSKSTLFMQFNFANIIPVEQFPVTIFADPIAELDRCLLHTQTQQVKLPEVFLPLYSTRDPQRKVAPKSGLNQWNAGGRERDPDEIYIPVPRIIHKNFTGFFPDNVDDTFQVILPTGNRITCKMCQDGLKGLMSNPNKLLGKWLLRDVLKIPERNLVTREMLNISGIDSVHVVKLAPSLYSIDFCGIGKYEDFIKGAELEPTADESHTD